GHLLRVAAPPVLVRLARLGDQAVRLRHVTLVQLEVLLECRVRNSLQAAQIEMACVVSHLNLLHQIPAFSAPGAARTGPAGNGPHARTSRGRSGTHPPEPPSCTSRCNRASCPAPCIDIADGCHSSL